MAKKINLLTEMDYIVFKPEYQRKWTSFAAVSYAYLEM